MRLQKHVKVGGVLGAVAGVGTVFWLLAIEGFAGTGSPISRFFSEWVFPVGTLFYGLLAAIVGMITFWLGGHILRFIKHQHVLASDRQVHNRLLKTKELLDAGIYTEEEFQAKIAELKK